MNLQGPFPLSQTEASFVLLLLLFLNCLACGILLQQPEQTKATMVSSARAYAASSHSDWLGWGCSSERALCLLSFAPFAIKRLVGDILLVAWLGPRRSHLASWCLCPCLWLLQTTGERWSSSRRWPSHLWEKLLEGAEVLAGRTDASVSRGGMQTESLECERIQQCRAQRRWPR